MDVTLNITIPDAHVTRVLDAFNAIAGARLTLEGEKGDMRSHWYFTIDPKGGGETNKTFGERCIRELGKAVINMVDLAQDENRYINDLDAIIPPSSDVPGDVLI